MASCLVSRFTRGFLIAAAMLLCGPGGLEAQENPRDVVVIGSPDSPPLSNDNQTGMLDQVVKEAFTRIGIRAQIVSLPAERSLINANRGINDGDLLRIGGLNRLYPNLIQVPVKLIDLEFVAFTKNVEFTPTDWSSLKPYSVGIITGWKILEENIVGARCLTKVRDAELLFKLLDRDRADVVIYGRLQGYGMMQKLGLKTVKPLEPPLVKREMFLYLNVKHRPIIEKLTRALEQMKSDGTYDRIADKTIGPYRNR
jgi:polar amino acid transport system substrate-binding protein